MSKERDLLAKIKRQAPVKEVKAPPVLPVKTKNGKGSQFWLYEEEEAIIRELYAWIASQGYRPNDSAIIRAALRLVKPGQAMLDAYRDAAKVDARAKK